MPDMHRNVRYPIPGIAEAGLNPAGSAGQPKQETSLERSASARHKHTGFAALPYSVGQAHHPWTNEGMGVFLLGTLQYTEDKGSVEKGQG